MANLPPPNHVADLPEDDPEEQPELAPEPDHLNEFAPHQIPQPEGNMNGWILEDDEEEEEEEDPEMEEEMEEENDDDDDAEVINPYEEADPLNLPPPDSDTESEDMAVAPYNNPRIFINCKTYFTMITIVRGNFSLYYITCIVNISVCHVTYITKVDELTQPIYGHPVFIYVKQTSQYVKSISSYPYYKVHYSYNVPFATLYQNGL
ncbi:hypothetical protein Tco_0633912 [Tanacetum coccineum]